MSSHTSNVEQDQEQYLYHVFRLLTPSHMDALQLTGSPSAHLAGCTQHTVHCDGAEITDLEDSFYTLSEACAEVRQVLLREHDKSWYTSYAFEDVEDEDGMRIVRSSL